MGFDIGGQGGSSFPFNNPGDTVTGKLVSMEEVQQTDLQTGKPATWDDGRPKMMYRVALATTLRADTDDDGERTVYLRGSRKPESQSSLAAVAGAVKAATGGTELEAGATLTLTYVGDGQPSQRGFNAPKLYSATYVAPTLNIAGDAFSTPPAGSAAPTGLPVGVTPEMLAALANLQAQGVVGQPRG
jgi:hypothetical protein